MIIDKAYKPASHGKRSVLLVCEGGFSCPQTRAANPLKRPAYYQLFYVLSKPTRNGKRQKEDVGSYESVTPPYDIRKSAAGNGEASIA